MFWLRVTLESKKSMLDLVIILGSLVCCGIFTSFALLLMGDEESLTDGNDCEGVKSDAIMEVSPIPCVIIYFLFLEHITKSVGTYKKREHR